MSDIRRQSFETVRQTICSRRTKKIVAERGPVEFDSSLLKEGEELLHKCIEAAGMAPFHYDRGLDCIAEPWRIHLLSNPACHELAEQLGKLVNLKPSSKLPCLLNGCCQMAIITWIPVDPKNPGSLSESKIQQVNNEHLCATAAVAQNLLLLVQSLGWDGYWGSGGLLQSDEVMDYLEIDRKQQIAAAIYVTFNNTEEAGDRIQVLPGKMHSKRSKWRQWTNFIDAKQTGH